MLTADFDYELPSDLIAQTPTERRDAARLMVLHRGRGQVEHRRFADLLDYLAAGDVLVLNNSRVIPARLRGRKSGSGGGVEVLLLEENQTNDWWVMLRPGKRVHRRTRIEFNDHSGRPTGIHGAVLDKNTEGHVRLNFMGTPDIKGELDRLGEVPLPPYIRREGPAVSALDCERYQTVYACPPGSVAAPTAGLHFTQLFLESIRRRGVEVRYVTLHVGLGTFAPVKAARVERHLMHEERFELPSDTTRSVNAAKSERRRVIAVGTTTVRVLEAAVAGHQGRLVAGPGRTRIFIYPPYDFGIADALLTNFHLPRSTLLMLASAFAAPKETRGRAMILVAYAEAIRESYRFFSYGDAMLIL
jgi:S-adenosylmethionine:tRNA ribosyltransferase-isomerase